ncbi:unnamed protein product [Cuscuta europaea]|uniref:Pectinesterase n=1 Tax=Cuscuta europaea TaxID=41803 RepID=A0A9P0ZQ49_CUSEU|nr:unnamed protein product [Cuscuta europaea]
MAGRTLESSVQPAVVEYSAADVEKQSEVAAKGSRTKIVMLVFSAVFLIASAAGVVAWVGLGKPSEEVRVNVRPTRAISHTCGNTRYPELCVDSLINFPGALTAANSAEISHVSVNLTLQKFGLALTLAPDIGAIPMSALERSAYDDCIDLLGESVDLLSQSLTAIGEQRSSEDVQNWLSAALTNQDTCEEGLQEAGGGSPVKARMTENLKDLSELVSNSLSIFAHQAKDDDDFAGVPISNRRRRLLEEEDFPEWVSRKERRLLIDTPAWNMSADIIVSKGNRTFNRTGRATRIVKTIGEAIKLVPENSTTRTVIYVTEGRYEEKILKIGKKKTNIMLVGDGMRKTIISGGRSVFDNITTFQTASFAATGNGFIARDITFENWAGAAKHQAVALRVGSDHSVIYRCEITGYQDTLYVHSQRQFYRECDIYGTVDFIFGNAAVVFQNCNIYARKPMLSQKNTITAQNRKDPYQTTGMSIHNCSILAAPDLKPCQANFSTYLGRPWKMYSRAVVMMSFIDDLVHPQGWLEWNTTFALDTLYYAEYNNTGRGAWLAQRVKWPGFQVLKTAYEASMFTVSKFIFGSTWLPQTGVAFVAGLTTS